MSESRDVYCSSSSQINDELTKKRRNERIGRILLVISQFLGVINSIQLKTCKSFFPEEFSNNSLIFLRSLSIWILGYFFCRKKGVRIKSLNDIRHKFWFVLRNFGSYISTFFWIKILSYFRVSTSHMIADCSPALVIFLSILILHEKFYFRYIIRVFVCIFGCALMVLNEKKLNVSKIKLYDNKLLGLFFVICYLFTNGFRLLGQLTNRITIDEQNYYLGMYSTLPALFFCIIEKHFAFDNIRYILYAFSNGLFIFHFSNYLQYIAFQYISISKGMIIIHMTKVLVFILGFILLGEIIYITDILGAGLIISFLLYEVYSNRYIE